MDEQEQLFSTVYMDAITVLDAAQLTPNQIMHKGYRWANVTTRECIEVVPFLHDRARPELQPDYIAPDYTLMYDSDFKYWVPEQRRTTGFSGFLVGAPILHNITSGEDTQTMHFWTDNSDILPSSIAVPAVDILSLEVCSQEVSDIYVDLHEVAMGALSRYQVPLLHKGGEWVFKQATTEDLVAALWAKEPTSRKVVYRKRRGF